MNEQEFEPLTEKAIEAYLEFDRDRAGVLRERTMGDVQMLRAIASIRDLRRQLREAQERIALLEVVADAAGEFAGTTIFLDDDADTVADWTAKRNALENALQRAEKP